MFRTMREKCPYLEFYNVLFCVILHNDVIKTHQNYQSLAGVSYQSCCPNLVATTLTDMKLSCFNQAMGSYMNEVIIRRELNLLDSLTNYVFQIWWPKLLKATNNNLSKSHDLTSDDLTSGCLIRLMWVNSRRSTCCPEY